MATLLPIATQLALYYSLRRYTADLGRATVRAALLAMVEGLEAVLNPQQEIREDREFPVTVGPTQESLRSELAAWLRSWGAPDDVAEKLNLDFKLDLAERVARGAASYVAQQEDVDEYPALELFRLFDRDVPRGFRRGPRQTLIPVPDDDWPSRFRDACVAAGDAAALRVLDTTGRMVALKSSGVWPDLGNNRPDTLGNPYPPFAFNSGYDVEGVPFRECVKLGLLAPDATPTGAAVDFGKLFAKIELEKLQA